MIFDLHVHTDYSSCSNLTLAELLDQAKQIGLDGVCITDHHSMQVKELLSSGRQENGLVVIIGMEYSTAQGDFLVFGLEDVPAEGLSAEQLLQLVTDRDGLAIAAHPYRTGRSVSEEVFRHGWCQIVEIVNGRNSDEDNQKAKENLSQYDLVQCGGSDAHSLEELGTVVTEIPVDIGTEADFINAIKEGLCTPCQHCLS